VSPSEEAARVAERLLTPLRRRWRHVQGVAAVAALLATDLPTEDAETLVASAWLHDIGYSPELVDSGFHPLDGARWLADEGFDSAVVALVAHHTGAAIEAEERGLSTQWAALPMPRPDLLARLTAADLSTSPDGELMHTRERIAEILVRYPAGDPVHRAVSRSGPALVDTAEHVLIARGLTFERLAAALAR